MKRSWIFAVILLSYLLTGSGCSIKYNFSGGAPPNPDIQTLYIENFANEATLVVPYLSQEFTETLQATFLNRSQLTLSDDNSDITIRGTITGYTITPVAIAGNETAEQNRLTIRANVKHDNIVVPECEHWNNTFQD